MRVAKADLVPTAANLVDDYGDFAALVAACAAFEKHVNGRPHAETRTDPRHALGRTAAGPRHRVGDRIPPNNRPLSQKNNT